MRQRSHRAQVSILAVIAGAALARPGAAEPLAEVSARVGAGLAAGGGSGRAALRASPVVATITGALAIREQPWTWAFAGLTLETYDRTGVGFEAGLAVAVGRRGRVRAGARIIAKPYTLHGATVGATWCWPSVPLRACVDVAGDVYIAGTDLPAGSAVAQLIVAVGTAFDAM